MVASLVTTSGVAFAHSRRQQQWWGLVYILINISRGLHCAWLVPRTRASSERHAWGDFLVGWARRGSSARVAQGGLIGTPGLVTYFLYKWCVRWFMKNRTFVQCALGFRLVLTKGCRNLCSMTPFKEDNELDSEEYEDILHTKKFEGHSYLFQTDCEFYSKENLVDWVKSRAKTVNTSRTIYNTRAMIKKDRMKGCDIVEEVLHLCSNSRYTYFLRNFDESTILSDIVFAHPTSIQMLKTWPYVLILDTNYKTNKYNMPLLEAVGMTPPSKNLCIATVFIRNEQAAILSLGARTSRVNALIPVSSFVNCADGSGSPVKFGPSNLDSYMDDYHRT
ncbi:hypothetical protein M9H77_16871 [Catharanthus roseus]|uniref:Uncharacterized protein n=1 Tax=Catharanthus roseus TaxID=4058 RepID=A0ACC0B309_CATRO|nr:hypothetical protein M9H77_16871 [Catharanthus roseus]